LPANSLPDAVHYTPFLLGVGPSLGFVANTLRPTLEIASRLNMNNSQRPSTALSDLIQSELKSVQDFSTRHRIEKIKQDLLLHSTTIRQPNFTVMHTRDLEFLFKAYDDEFFAGLCRVALAGCPLYFSFSKRMTRTGAATKRFRMKTGEIFYEIAIASGILFDGFNGNDRETTVCGLECNNRLDALQRFFEHELIHLVEFLCWEDSNCSAQRFQTITSRFFGHQTHTHNLITRHERAADAGIRVGSRVSFEFEGRLVVGRVNRITKRVTVLVEDGSEAPYANGRHYKKFYVPIRLLSAAPMPSQVSGSNSRRLDDGQADEKRSRAST